MSPERLNELEQLARAATAGPWESQPYSDSVWAEHIEVEVAETNDNVSNARRE